MRADLRGKKIADGELSLAVYASYDASATPPLGAQEVALTTCSKDLTADPKVNTCRRLRRPRASTDSLTDAVLEGKVVALVDTATSAVLGQCTIKVRGKRGARMLDAETFEQN